MWQLVDVAKPGDRVEITGIYRASSVRVNPRHRTVRALYKTYIDIVHIRKLERGRRMQSDTVDVTTQQEARVSYQVAPPEMHARPFPTCRVLEVEGGCNLIKVRLLCRRRTNFKA